METVQTIRSKLGLTQAELADQLGLHQATISRLETGGLELDKRTRMALDVLVAKHKPSRLPRPSRSPGNGMPNAAVAPDAGGPPLSPASTGHST